MGASSCQDLCARDSTCRGWTFMKATNSDTKQCWLKDSNLDCSAPDADQQWNTYTSGFCNGECSGPTPSPSPPSSECAAPLPGKDNHGNNMASSPRDSFTGDASSCQDLCARDSTCKGWTFMKRQTRTQSSAGSRIRIWT